MIQNFSNTTASHNAGLLALAIFVTIAIAGALWIEAKWAKRREAEREAMEKRESQVAGYNVKSLAEARFWQEIKLGPNRLTEMQILRAAEKLAKIRTGYAPGPHAILEAKRQVERHVGRAIELGESPAAKERKVAIDRELAFLDRLKNDPPMTGEGMQVQIEALCQLRGIDKHMDPAGYARLRREVFDWIG